MNAERMQQARIVKSVLWYLCFCFCLNCTDIIVKTIATTAAPISMALFLRGLLGFVTFYPKSSLLTHHTSWQTWALNAIRATST